MKKRNGEELGEGIDDGGMRGLSRPMAVLVQEASDLAHICAEPEYAARLAAAGLARGRVVELCARIARAQSAASAWVTLRGETLREEHEEVRTRAIRMLARFRAAARFHGRGYPEEKQLTAREPGRSRAALVQHLDKVANLIERSSYIFTKDDSWGAFVAAQDAHDVARELESLPNLALQRAERASARRVRDSAFAALREIVSEVRSATRYAFHGEPALKRRFASAHAREGRAQARQKGAQARQFEAEKRTARAQPAPLPNEDEAAAHSGAHETHAIPLSREGSAAEGGERSGRR